MTFDKALESHKQKMSERETELLADKMFEETNYKHQKYQEALDSLRKECKATFVNEKGIRMYSSNKNDDERCNTIQQLIDKLPYWLELEEKEIRLNKIEIELNNLHKIFHHGGRGELPKALSDLIFKIELDWRDEE